MAARKTRAEPAPTQNTSPDVVQDQDTIQDQAAQSETEGQTDIQPTEQNKTKPSNTEIAVFSFYNNGKDTTLKDYGNFKVVSGWNFLKIPKQDVQNPETILDTLSQKGFKFSTYQLTRQQPQTEAAQ